MVRLEKLKGEKGRTMAKGFLFFIIMLLIYLVVSCGNDVIVYTDQDKPINTTVGDEFIVSIQHDPPGYYWKEHHDKDMLSQIEETYGPVQKESNAVTFAGTQYFRYKSLKPGITYITLTQLRLSEPDIAREKVFKVNIKPSESSEAQNTPRKLTNGEKIRVIEIALDNPKTLSSGITEVCFVTFTRFVLYGEVV